MTSAFWKNCQANRRRKAKICAKCPVRPLIEHAASEDVLRMVVDGAIVNANDLRRERERRKVKR